jgi:hypothetical protein
MHALAPPVLLRMAGLDALDLDAQAQPPDGKLRETEEADGAGEGNAVVGADGVGQAALAKQPVEGGDGEILPRGLQGLAQEQEARGGILIPYFAYSHPEASESGLILLSAGVRDDTPIA